MVTGECVTGECGTGECGTGERVACSSVADAIAHARQVAMFLARRLTNHSLEDIGGYFGGRDHSTVLHAIDKIDGLAKSDPQCGDTVAELLAQLRQRTT